MRSLVVLVRHGRTAWNVERRFQGQQDIPLDEVGRIQSFQVAAALGRYRPDLIVSSDLSRARDTAAPLAAELGLQVAVDPRLREVDMGTWQGLDDAQTARSHPDEHERWRQGEDVRRGGGETYAEVALRGVAAVTDATAAAGPGGSVVIVSHGGTARAIIASLLALHYPQWSVIGPLGNGGWSTLLNLEVAGEGPAGPGRWRLLQHNASAEPGGLPAAVGPVGSPTGKGL